MMMMMMMMKGSMPCRHELIWVKSSPTFSMGRLDYSYQHEPILYGWKGKNRRFYGENERSVWNIDKAQHSKLHPTMKPVELVERAIKNSSKTNNTVLDLFGGAGSTLIACEKTNRICYMMEIDPHYIDIIIARWEKFTNKKAAKVKSHG
jgi:DNA modification methylase